MPSNRFEVLRDRVMHRGEGSKKEKGKDRKIILKEKRAKKGVEVQQTRVEKREDKEIVIEVLLDSRVMELVMSKEFVRKHKFRRTKLEMLIYMKNVDKMLNYVGLIVNIVKIELFFKEHKKRMSIDVIGGQKWSIILEILQLACYNPEIDWKTEEVQITRCPNECRKKWRTEKQTELGWQKQKETTREEERVQKADS